MSSSQWCSASKNALTSGVVIRGARFPYNAERIAEVEKRRIEPKKSWAIKGGYFGRGGKERPSYFRACQYVVHQLCGLGLLNLQMIPACRLGENFACTSPQAAPFFIWRQDKKYVVLREREKLAVTGRAHVVSTGYFFRKVACWPVADDGRIFVHYLPDGRGGGEDNERGVAYLHRINVAVLTCHLRHSASGQCSALGRKRRHQAH